MLQMHPRSECLELMHGMEGVSTQSLLDYVTDYISDYLDAVDLSTIEAPRKAPVGLQLLGLFVNDKIIDRWWAPERL